MRSASSSSSLIGVAGRSACRAAAPVRGRCRVRAARLRHSRLVSWLPGSMRFQPGTRLGGDVDQVRVRGAGAQVEAAASRRAAVAGVVGAAVVLEDRLLDEVVGGGEDVALGLDAVGAAAVALVVVAVVALLGRHHLHAVAAHRRRADDRVLDVDAVAEAVGAAGDAGRGSRRRRGRRRRRSRRAGQRGEDARLAELAGARDGARAALEPRPASPPASCSSRRSGRARAGAGAHGEAQQAAGGAAGGVEAGLLALVDLGDGAADQRRAVRRRCAAAVSRPRQTSMTSVCASLQVDVAQQSADRSALQSRATSVGGAQARALRPRRRPRPGRTARRRAARRGSRCAIASTRPTQYDAARAMVRWQRAVVGAEVAPHRQIGGDVVRPRRRRRGQDKDQRSPPWNRGSGGALRPPGCAHLPTPRLAGSSS